MPIDLEKRGDALENEYFHRKEQELIAKMKAKLQEDEAKSLEIKCPKCDGKLEKQWSLSGFQFKGAGWYVTDYAGKKGATANTEKNVPAESTVSTDPASNSTSKSTTKEAAAKPAKNRSARPMAASPGFS